MGRFLGDLFGTLSSVFRIGRVKLDTSAATAALRTVTFPDADLNLGTAFQPSNANLSALAGLSGAANQGAYFTAAGAMSVYDLTVFGRLFSAAADDAAGRSLLGLGTAATRDTGTSGANVPMLNAGNTWGASQTISNGSGYVSWGLSRMDQSGAGNTDAAFLDIVTGNGAARFLHSGGGQVRGIAIGRAADKPQWFNGTTYLDMWHASVGGVVIADTGTCGYGSGAGGAVTQATDKTTTVTLNKPSGRITLAANALAAGATASFTVNNNKVAASDCVLINISGTTIQGTNYRVEVVHTIAGAFRVRTTNISGGSLSEALVINFVVIKGTAA